ncbi:MAG: hypothetical protein AAFV29_08610, partial [Myxococcota bacterium]
RATDGGPTQYIPLAFEVPQYRVATSVGRPEQIADGSIQVPIDIHVTDEAGQGIDGLSFKAGALADASTRLLTSTSSVSILEPCKCRMPAGASGVTALKNGRYRWMATTPAGTPLPSTVRFYVEEGARAVEAKLPAMRVVGRPEIARSSNGFFFTLHGGTWLGTNQDPVFQASLGVGAAVAIDPRLSIDLSALARWSQRRDVNEDLNIFPVTARVAMRYVGWTAEPYFGGGAGVRLGDLETRPVGEVFAGLLMPMGPLKLDLEAGYVAAGDTDNIDELAGFSLRLGLRWQP